MWVNVAAALLPVVVFLAILFLMDSFKLVRIGTVAMAVGAGVASAFVATALYAPIADGAGITPAAFSRYVAPVTEETLKAVFIVILLKRGRVGFLVDGAILGFAVGTGFALVENLEYLRDATHAGVMFWVARGFGTAVLHGATTAVFAMLAKGLSDRHAGREALTLAAAWAVPVAVHSVFNHFLLPPLITTLLLLVLLPLGMSFVFARSERATHEWVGEGLDLDVELLNLVTSSSFGGTRLGGYLRELTSRFPGPVVADMFCLLRVELELAIRAKGLLMARQAGLEVPADSGLKARLLELRYLKASIGKTGMLALSPLLMTTDRDDWHRFLLEQSGDSGPAERLRDALRSTWRRIAK